MLLNENIHDPQHFDKYTSYIRRRDHPTSEELAEEEQKRIKKQEEKEKLKDKKK